MQDAPDGLVVQVRNSIVVLDECLSNLLLANDGKGMGVDQVLRLHIANQTQCGRPDGGVTVLGAAQGIEVGEYGPKMVVQYQLLFW